MTLEWVGPYWPWWLGALALAAVALAHVLLVSTPLGVSGLFTRIVQARAEQAAARREREFADDAAFEAALVAATERAAAAMGMAAAAPECAEPTPGAASCGAPSPGAAPLASTRGWEPAAVFLGALVAGGLIATVVHGDVVLTHEVGGAFSRSFGDGPLSWGVLLGGGALVGFGTRMAGGCTSGHGLSGVSRLQPASLLATAVFFGAAVLVSFALARVG